MTLWICATCGVEHAETPQPPELCAICSDDRQWVPQAGQAWTTQDELAGKHEFVLTEIEPDLFGMQVSPEFAIGQHALLVRTPGGNLLWEPSGVMTASMVEAVRDLGGIAAVTASHPHLTGASVSWSHAFGGVPVYVNADDKRWIRRPDDAIELWRDRIEVLPGLTLVQAGGHFPGSSVAQWRAGARGNGALLVGDTLMVAADRTSVSFMRSYPNYIPMSERLVRKIEAALEPLAYDRIYGAFSRTIAHGAPAVVGFSADRYVAWIRDDIRDPDERV